MSLLLLPTSTLLLIDANAASIVRRDAYAPAAPAPYFHDPFDANAASIVKRDADASSYDSYIPYSYS